MTKPGPAPLALLTASFLLACAVDDPMDTGNLTVTTTMTTMTSMTTMPTTIGDGDGDDDPDDTDGGNENCGDGVPDDGEQCDFGEMNSESGQCTPDCTI